MPTKWLGDNFINELGWRLFDFIRQDGESQGGSSLNLEDLYEKLKVENRTDVEQAINNLATSSDKHRRRAGEKLLEWHQEWSKAGTENNHISVLANKYLMFLADNSQESITKTEKGDEVETKREIERNVQAAREDFERWLVQATSKGKDHFEQRLGIIEDNPLENFLRKVKNSYSEFQEKNDFSKKREGAKVFIQHLVTNLTSIDYLSSLADRFERANEKLRENRSQIREDLK